MINKSSLSSYCVIILINPDCSINSFDLDQIFTALKNQNSLRERDVLLIILSDGGSIEIAYQISKLCKSFAKEKFVVAIPRQAKSAATLIALGADEIHMSALGQLGPIDPQIGGLPALGITQALQTIASLSQQFPGSAEMFANYLRLALTVAQIGYSERICDSAVQYAERLLQTKEFLATDEIKKIASSLVHTYKDHSFVIDLAEAKGILGNEWIKTDTPELTLAESIYQLHHSVCLNVSILKNQILIISGDCTTTSALIIDRT